MSRSAKIGVWLGVLLALVLVAMTLMFRAGSVYTPGPTVPGVPKPAATPPANTAPSPKT